MKSPRRTCKRRAKALAVWVALCTLCAALAAAPARASGGEFERWAVDGTERQALVFAPSKQDASGKAPVILAFHGHGGDMNDAQQGMHFETYWPEAAIVYLQGLPTNPADDPAGYGWVYRADGDGQRDLKFVDAVLATLRQKYAIDDRRIYATGFSNGGMFSYVLWATRPDVFAAFAIVSGRIPDTVQLRTAKPLLVVAGERDRQVRFKDQLAAMATARKVNGTGDTGKPCGGECVEYESSQDAPVITYIHGGGHVYPAGAPYLTVKFFQQHSLGK